MGEQWCYHRRYLGSDEVSGFIIGFRFILPRSKPASGPYVIQNTDNPCLSGQKFFKITRPTTNSEYEIRA